MDPIGTKDDPNLYLYVGLDPVNATDPTGEQTITVRPPPRRQQWRSSGGVYITVPPASLREAQSINPRFRPTPTIGGDGSAFMRAQTDAAVANYHIIGRGNVAGRGGPYTYSGGGSIETALSGARFDRQPSSGLSQMTVRGGFAELQAMGRTASGGAWTPNGNVPRGDTSTVRIGRSNVTFDWHYSSGSGPHSGRPTLGIRVETEYSVPGSRITRSEVHEVKVRFVE